MTGSGGATATRLKRAAPLAALLVCLLVGLYLVFVEPSPESRIRATLADLVSAVEGRDQKLLASALHPDYAGWGSSKDAVVGAFGYAITLYTNADVELADIVVTVNPDGKTATADFHWSSDSGVMFRKDLSSKFGPTHASATFAVDPADGGWKLTGFETDVPFPEPR